MLNNLEQALKTGFIDKQFPSDERLQPRLLLNDKRTGTKVLSTLLEALGTCDEFWFSVAFVTRSGLACIHNRLIELEAKGVRGKILVSQYLNFTEPEALRLLHGFQNIETRFIQDHRFHGKGYIFKNSDQYELIIGSSNLTSSALCENAELNIKLTSSDNSGLIHETLNSFAQFFEMAHPLTPDLISSYEDTYEAHRLNHPQLYSEKLLPGLSNNQVIFKPNAMQVEALETLDSLRKQGAKKSLVISATGTGKTLLAAFDVKAFQAKKLLFVVHRGTIARKAMESFKFIFGSDRTMGLYTGGLHELDADFVFCTVQTINNERHLNQFGKQEFDYIIIDETHRAGAKTYRKVLDYFEPRFLLGMTATPERMDGFDIFPLFDHNIAHEIRLKSAMDQGLVSPFHYFGVTDISIGGNPLDENSDFNLLIAPERVDRIIEIAEQYGCDSGVIRGLVFCSRVDEANELSRLFELRGYRAISLSGTNSETERLQAITNLESTDDSQKIDYIFTVDVFNEGVDIPRVNQIIMLRPTQSATIFVQQLGRGLRNTAGKDYLTVIDFIGNYQNNYMIPIALYGDSSYSKDTLRKFVAAGSSLIPGSSTVNFDEIAQEKIFESIDSANLNRKKDLSHDYQSLKSRLGRVPMMLDYLSSNSRDPYSFVDYSKSYLNFVNIMENNVTSDFPIQTSKLLEYFSRLVNDGKRIEESLLLSLLVKHSSVSTGEFNSELNSKYGFELDEISLDSVVRNIGLNFVTERSGGNNVPIGRLHGYEIADRKERIISRGKSLTDSLSYERFKEFLVDNIQYSLDTYKNKFNISDYVGGFLRYQKYSRKDVFRILNWPENPNPQNVGGYFRSPDKSNCPIFVTYQKNEDISESINYGDEFQTPSRLTYMSKNRRTLESPDVLAFQNQSNSGIRLPLFVKKSDDEGKEFYFTGDLRVIENSFIAQSMKDDDGNDVSVVKMEFNTDVAVKQDLYTYLTS